jgi:ketosteroid isomerase-like protein
MSQENVEQPVSHENVEILRAFFQTWDPREWARGEGMSIDDPEVVHEPRPRRAYAGSVEAGSRNDVDALIGFYAADAVLDLSDAGLGTFEGVAAVRTFLEDWSGTWGEHLIQAEEIVDLGDGVVWSRVREDGRLVGSDRHVEQRLAMVFVWARGRIERQTAYFDVDEARAAAERLAESRG